MVHIGELMRPRKTEDYGIMVLPGGFTDGDDLGSGKVIANEISLKLGDDVALCRKGRTYYRHLQRFPDSAKSGLLPDPSAMNTKQRGHPDQ